MKKSIRITLFTIAIIVCLLFSGLICLYLSPWYTTHLLEKAEQALFNRDSDTALTYLMSVINRDDCRIEAYEYLMAIAENKYGTNSKQRMKICDEAIKTIKSNNLTDPLCGLFYFEKGMYYFNINQPDEAFGYFKKAVSIDLKHAKAYKMLGGLCNRYKSTMKQGIKYSKKAIEIDPYYYNAFNNLAYAYDQLGYKDLAITYYNEALRLNPSYEIAHANRALVYMDKNEYNLAIEDWDWVIANDKHDRQAWYSRGICYYNLGEYEQAIDDLNSSSRYMDADLYTALCYYHTNQYAKMNSALKRAIDLDPDNSAAYLWRATVKTTLNNYSGALDDYNKVLELDNDEILALTGRADVHAKQNNIQKAYADYDLALSIDPNDPQTYVQKGKLALEQNDISIAADCFQQAHQLAPEQPDVLYYMAETQTRMEEDNDALNTIDKLLQIDEANAPAWSLAAELYIRKNDLRGAYICTNRAAFSDIGYDKAWEIKQQLYPNLELLTFIQEYYFAEETTLVARRTHYLMNMYRYDEAYDLCDTILSMDPTNIDFMSFKLLIIYDTSIVFHRSMDKTIVMQLCDSILSRFPASHIALSIKGLLLTDDNQNERAKELLDEAIQLAPDVPFVHIALAQHYIAKMKMEDAFKEIEKAEQIAKQNQVLDDIIVTNVGLLKQTLRLDKALECINDYINSNPSNMLSKLQMLYQKAWILHKTGQNSEALEIANYILRFSKKEKDTLILKVQILTALNEYSKAYNIAKLLATYYPENTEVLICYARTLYKIEQNDQALKVAQKILVLDPDNLYAKHLIHHTIDLLNTWKNDPPKLFLDYYNDAWRSYQDHDYDRALQRINQAIAFDPSEAQTWYIKGIFLKNINKKSEALGLFNKSTELRPDFSRAWYEKAFIYRDMGHYDKGLACIEKALLVNPYNYDFWLNKAFLLTKQKKFYQAMEAYKQSLAIDPEYIDSYINFTYLPGEYLSHKKAVKLTNIGLFHNPMSAQLWNNRGYALYLDGIYDEALYSFEQASELDINYIHPQFNIIILLVKTGRAHEALVRLNESLRHSDKILKSLLMRPVILSKLEKGLTPEILNKLDDCRLWFNSGEHLIRIEDYPEALEAFNGVIARNPDIDMAWYHKGNVLLKLNRYEKALEAFDHAIECTSNSALFTAGRGIALLKLNRLEEAIDALQESTTLNPESAESYYYMGIAQYKAGNVDASIDAITQAVRLNDEYKFKAQNDSELTDFCSDPKCCTVIQ